MHYSVKRFFKSFINPDQQIPIRSMKAEDMYHAKSIKDLLKTVPLTEDFFTGLDPFHLNFIDMCFKKSLDEQMGMMSEVEFANYQIFMKYKSEYEEEFYIEIKNNKKAS